MLLKRYLILGGGGTSARPRAAAADGGEAWRGDKGVLLASESLQKYISKKQLQEVEEHVKLLTSKETELAEAIERLEAEGEVMLQIH